MSNQYILTYGTLKKGFYNHYLIEHLEYVDEAMTCEKFQMYPSVNYAFPFVIKSEKNNQIFGEVYKLTSSKDLDLLDELEGYPDLYIREEIEIMLSIGRKINAIMYFKNEINYKEHIKLDEPILEWAEDVFNVNDQ